jgi:hypothetical protein
VAILAVRRLLKSCDAEEVLAGVGFGVRVPALLAYAAGGFYAATVLFRPRPLQ